MSLLQLHQISKSYAGVRALRDVDFHLAAGEVHALVGENGAGKSTLIKIITGAVVPDSGTLSWQGAPVTHATPAAALAAGIRPIYQQPALFPQLTVAENIGLALEPAQPFHRIDWPQRRRQARELLARLAAPISPDAEAGSLSMAHQQIVEIAKAIGSQARVFLFDEPTACLSDRETQQLFTMIRSLRALNAGIIYISHRLEELPQIAGRVTILRDGQVMGTHPMADLTPAQLIRLMVGRDLPAPAPTPPQTRTQPVLQLTAFGSRATGTHDINLTVHAGEIVGLAGLMGAGRSELAALLFGLAPADSGTIALHGRPVNIKSVDDARRLGIAYVPEDRRRNGIIGALPVVQNMTLATLTAVSRHWLLSSTSEASAAQYLVDRLSIKTASLSTPVEQLSGGNQQKVSIAKWLATKPQLLIVDEPTQGVDVGAKAEVHALIRDLAMQGCAVIVISSDLEEVLSLSDRIAVMTGGTITGIVDRAGATAEQLLQLAFGHTGAAR